MKLIVKGKVQKVGFRYSVVDYVISGHLPLVGHVKNCSDGSVEVIAQGDIESLKDLHRFCTKGPPRAEVREVEQELIPLTGVTLSGFGLLTD